MAGLIGSTAYVNAPPIPVDQMAAYFNFDMVGRMQDNKLTVQATGSSDAWGRLIEQANIAAGFDLQLQSDPYQPTDVATFNQAGVPSLNFFTGTHTDYHRPSDTADKIDYEDLDRVVDFAASIARRVADADQPPGFVKVDQPTDSGGGRAGVRVFTGTIPDYSNEVKGLLLSGIITLSISNWSQVDPHYGKFPAWFPVLVITRDAVILIGSALLHVLNGTMRVRTSWTGKVATVLQMAAIAWVMLQMRIPPLIYIVVAAGFFTLVSGMIYVRDGFRQLSAEGHSNAKVD